MPFTKRLLACAAVLALSIGVLPAKKSKKVDLSKWYDGPVRYISVREEQKAFRELTTDEDRAYFIERFWNRRDPTQGTLTNEYRQGFWERVQQANNSFVDSPREGWMTDRGKIYVLYGPPSHVYEDTNLSTGEAFKAGRGIIRWTYEGRPAGRKDLNPTVVVPFERDASGEYKLSHDPRLASVFFDPLAIRERWAEQDSQNPDFLPTGRSELSVMLDLGKMQEVPPHEQVLIERVETAESYRTEPVAVMIDRFLHPEVDEYVAVVTVDLTGFTSEQPAIMARFTPFDATKDNRILGEGSFRLETDGERLVAQGRIHLDPGRYALTLIVADPVATRTGMHRADIEVFEPTDRLRFSDIQFAQQLESLDYASLASYDEPFLIGPFRVVPAFGDLFKAGEPVRLFYEVYGAKTPLQVSYQLQGKEQDGSWVDLGAPVTGEQQAISQAWELATSPGWPAGDYRIAIEVLDARERLIGTHKAFRLER